jgi:hypothetical protein
MFAIVSIAEAGASAGISHRTPRRNVGSALGHHQARAQFVGRPQRRCPVTCIAGNPKERHSGAEEDEPDVMGVAIACAFFDQDHAIRGEFEVLFVSRVQIARQQQADPEPAEPIAVAPVLAGVARRNADRHRVPRAVRKGHIRKGRADSRFILQRLSGDEVERDCDVGSHIV